MTFTRRVVPIVTVHDIDRERKHYARVLGLSEVMNHGWIVTLAGDDGTRQISLMTRDQTAPLNPHASVEVDDVDTAYETARAQGLEIVHELQDEPWGVRRFFFRDSSGNVINVLSHRGVEGADSQAAKRPASGVSSPSSSRLGPGPLPGR
jgi:catechol 2,3-dioxygenase-like lactoylglutathione lyase family enzyme